MTAYYNISTNDVSEYWDTNKIIEYINDSKLFLYKNNGCFECVNEYSVISLVYTNNFYSFVSPNDFDSNKTNYIDIVTSFELSDEMMYLLKNLAQKYADRIIKFEDGVVVSNSNPNIETSNAETYSPKIVNRLSNKWVFKLS